MEDFSKPELVALIIEIKPETARVLRGLSDEYNCPAGTLVDHMVAICYPSYDPRRERILTELAGVLDVEQYRFL